MFGLYLKVIENLAIELLSIKIFLICSCNWHVVFLRDLCLIVHCIYSPYKFMSEYFIFFGVNVSPIFMFNFEQILRILNSSIYRGISRLNFMNYILAFIGDIIFKIFMKTQTVINVNEAAREIKCSCLTYLLIINE